MSSVQLVLPVFLVPHCGNCGVLITGRQKRFCSIPCRDTVLRGENHQCWKGGASKVKHPYSFSKKLKDKIRERDGFVCSVCECQDRYGRALAVHHIDCDKTNDDPRNLITLCDQCHFRDNTHTNPVRIIELRALAEHRNRFDFSYK